MGVSNTIAIILAAGLSKRMGSTNKLIHPLGKSTILEQSLSRFEMSMVDEIILVLGHQFNEVNKLPLVSRLKNENRLKITINENYEQGLGSSISTAIKQIDDKCDACLIGLGDMPFVKSETINLIISQARKSQEPQIVRPSFNGRAGHPILWKKNLFPDLLKLNKDQGGKDIIQQHKNLLKEVEVNDEGIFLDIDTIENFENLKNKLL